MSVRLTKKEKDEYKRIQEQISSLQRKLRQTSDSSTKVKLQKQIKALRDRLQIYIHPERLEGHRRNEERREAAQQQRAQENARVRGALQPRQGSVPPLPTPPYPFATTQNTHRTANTPIYAQSRAVSQAGRQSSSQNTQPSSQPKSRNRSTRAGSSRNGTRSTTTTTHRRTTAIRSQGRTRPEAVQQTVPLGNANLDRVVRMTPTYLRNFLVQAKIITEEESNSNRSSNKLRELLRNKLSSLTTEQRDLLNAYVTEQNKAITEHWNDIRTSGGNADSDFDMTKAIMQRDGAAAQPQDNSGDEPEAANTTTTQPQQQEEQQVSPPPAAKEVTTESEPSQPVQPTYPHLPQNLISAVRNNPEKMYKYFRRHSKSCGNFKEAFSSDKVPSAAEMLDWLENHYPNFKESRKQKIDVACRRRDLGNYIYPPLEGNSESATKLREQIRRHMINTYHVIPVDDSEQELAKAYRRLSSEQRDRFNSEIEKYVKENQIEVNLYYGHATGGPDRDQENTNRAGQPYQPESRSQQNDQRTVVHTQAIQGGNSGR